MTTRFYTGFRKTAGLYVLVIFPLTVCLSAKSGSELSLSPTYVNYGVKNIFDASFSTYALK